MKNKRNIHTITLRQKLGIRASLEDNEKTCPPIGALAEADTLDDADGAALLGLIPPAEPKAGTILALAQSSMPHRDFLSPRGIRLLIELF